LRFKEGNVPVALESPNAALPDQGFEVLAIAHVIDAIHAGNMKMKIKTNICALPIFVMEWNLGSFRQSHMLSCSLWLGIFTHKDRRDMDYVYPIISKIIYMHATESINTTAPEYR
jgi:hypothetical protein